MASITAAHGYFIDIKIVVALTGKYKPFPVGRPAMQVRWPCFGNAPGFAAGGRQHIYDGHIFIGSAVMADANLFAIKR